MTATVMIALLALGRVGPRPDSICALARVDRGSTLSSTCLSCHDGSAAPAVGRSSPTSPSTHPVGVRYAGARRAVAIRALGPLDSRVVLPGGRVECVTCHAATGFGPHQTVIAPRDLCVGCHQK